MLWATGTCHCGAIQLQLNNVPSFSAICHCNECKTIHAAPYVPLVAVADPPSFVVTKQQTTSCVTFDDENQHITCTICSTTVCSRHPKLRCYTVPLSILALSPKNARQYSPSFHMHYRTGITSCFDGLPKYPFAPPTIIRNDTAATLCPENLHGGSKPEERGRNCSVEASGHYRALLSMYENQENGNGGPLCTGGNKWKDERHTVQCLCGDVQLEVLGSPDWAANCHCSVCRALHGCAFVSLCGYSTNAVHFVHGKKFFDKKTRVYNCNGTSMEDRHACKSCGSWVMTEMRHLKCRAVFLPNISMNMSTKRADDFIMIDGRFKPSCHIFYDSGIVNVGDDLPKFQGFPPNLGGSDRVMLPNDLHHSNYFGLWKEAKGTVSLGCIALLMLLTTPMWGNVLNDEWESMPWIPIRNVQGIQQQWLALPTFLICEYTMYVGTLAAFVHAKNNGAIDLWFAAWICGTANDIFFMFLPFCDNFWQAQATIMLTPRLPLYIVCMYVVLIYWSNTASRRFGFQSSIAEACLTGLLAALLYSVYDLNGPRYLWWTWHDSDAAIFERLGGAPIGSTMWILTYSSLCNLLYRWCTRSGYNEISEILEYFVVWMGPRGSERGRPQCVGSIWHRCCAGKCVAAARKFTRCLDRFQGTRRSGPIAANIVFVCVTCTPLFMVLLGQFSVFSLDVPGKPGIRTLALTCLVFTAVTVKCGVYAKEQQPRLKGSGGKGDRLVGVLFFAYFASHLWMMISFDPTTHVSTGVHQKWSSTCRNSTAYDIMGLIRQDHVCSTGPIDASKHDYAWGQQCVNFSNLKSNENISPMRVEGDDAERNKLVEWYTVCGVDNSPPELARMVFLSVLGVLAYGRAFLL